MSASFSNRWTRALWVSVCMLMSICCKAQEKDIVTYIPSIKNIPWGSVAMFFFDSEGYLWYSTEEGLCRDNGYQTDVFCANEQNPKLIRSNYVMDIAEDGKGHIWFSTSQGAYMLDKKDYSIHSIAVEETQRVPIQSLIALTDGTIWLSTSTALFHLDADGRQKQRIDVRGRGKSPKFVNAFMEDSQHTLWLAQSNGCMWRYDINKKDFIPYVMQEDVDPQCMVEDVDHGCYWIGSWGKGIVKFIPNMVGNRATTELQPATMSLEFDGMDKVMDIELDSHANILWVVTTGGVFAYEIDADNNLRLSSISDRLPKGKYYYTNITSDKHGNLWVSGASRHSFMLPRYQNGIRKYAGHKVLVHDEDNLLETIRQKQPDVLRAVQDRQGNIFFQSQQKGLCMIRRGDTKAVPLLQEYETCSAMSLLSDGTLIIGTSIGRVYTYNCIIDKAPRYIAAVSNANGKRILDIRQDGKGHVWVLTRENVKEWDRTTRGYRTLYCNHPMIRMDHFTQLMSAPGDSICILEENSYCHISPTDFSASHKSLAKPCVSTIVIDGQKHFVRPEQSDMDIDSKANVVELHLTTLQQHLAEQVQFAYRLTRKSLFGSSSKDWVELPIGSNIIVLTSPAKGDYTVEVRATNGQGIWNVEHEVFRLHRLPAWWESGWAYMLYLLLTLSVIIEIFKQYSKHVQRKRMTQMEEQLTELKFRFFTNVSHELRTPLTLILVPVEQMLASASSLSGRDRNRLESIQRNALELQQLINQLLDFRRMELGAEHISPRNADMVQFLSAAVETFQPLAQRKHIELCYIHPKKALYAAFDHEKMHRIVWNLLSNAMKFTPEEGHVWLELQIKPEDNNRLIVHVKDDGVGIKANDVPYIFDRYFQSDNINSKGGSGIGLHMVRELVRLHGGDVGVESQEGKGSDFWFEIPLVCEQHSINEDSAAQTSISGHGAEDDSVTAQEETSNTSITPSILLVEDNLELRVLIAEQLRDEGFDVNEASNGQEAWEQLSAQPDTELVISDVMMPLMDGFELCRRIKGTENVSHIPVILLTAKTSDEDQLEGYKMGADCYLTKPFSPAVLLNRIRHLQEQRRVTMQHFQHDDSKEVAQLTYSPIDEEIITRAKKLVEEHLADKNYNVDQFSSDMCASRMTLYRKIHSITGLSPSDFIITIRLKHAAHLLSTTSLSASAISERTGFSSPSYFTKHFKKFFGVLPKEYRVKSNMPLASGKAARPTSIAL